MVTVGSQDCIPDNPQFELTVSSQTELLVHPGGEDLTGQVCGAVGTGVISHMLDELLLELLVLDGQWQLEGLSCFGVTEEKEWYLVLMLYFSKRRR